LDLRAQAHRAEIRGDIANYTDIAPVVQISEVVVEPSGELPGTALPMPIPRARAFGPAAA